MSTTYKWSTYQVRTCLYAYTQLRSGVHTIYFNNKQIKQTNKNGTVRAFIGVKLVFKVARAHHQSMFHKCSGDGGGGGGGGDATATWYCLNRFILFVY